MIRRYLALITAVVVSTFMLLALFSTFSQASSIGSQSAPGADPMISGVIPTQVANDLDTIITITGTNFSAVLSVTQVITPPAVWLGYNQLQEVGWVSSTLLTATIPWGMDPSIYTLRVTNPDGGSGSLDNAITVVQGVDVWTAGELYGGEITQIAVNPITPTTLYGASFNIGLFRSRDGGENWTLQFSGTGVQDLAIDPSSPQHLYMHGPWSLYRSDDEGDTWIPLTTNFPYQPTPGKYCWSFEQPYPHPTQPGTLYAASCKETHGSGLLKSSDYGATWMPSMGGITDTQVTALAFHPLNPLTMALGTASGNVFVSNDGGANWEIVARPVGYVNMLAFDPFGTHDLWVGAHAGNGDPCGIAKTTDSSLKNWIDIQPPAGGSWCDGAKIRFSPDVSGTIYVATWWGNGYLSTDGGVSWTVFGPGGLVFANDFAPFPGDPDTIFMADRRFAMHRTEDGGASWQSSSNGIAAVAPDQLAMNPLRPDVVYGIMNDTPGIYRAAQGGATWQFLPAHNAVGVSSFAVDPFIVERVYLGVYGGVLISSDDGQSWPVYADFPIPPEYATCRPLPRVLRAHPSQPGLLLAGLLHWCDDYITAPGGIYRSLDYGETWERMSTDQEIQTVADLAFDLQSADIAYALTDGEQFLKSIDNGLTWQTAGIGLDDMDYAQSIAQEPMPPYRIFLASRGGGPNLFISQDQGENFQSLPWNPDLGINVQQILFTPSDPAFLYAASPTGLRRSLDGGVSWSHAPGLLGQANTRSLCAVQAVDRTILYAGAAGNATEIPGFSMSGDIQGSGGLLSAGVYRYTSLAARRIYIPTIYLSKE